MASLVEAAASVEGNFTVNSCKEEGVPDIETAAIVGLANRLKIDGSSIEPLADPLTLLRFLRARDGKVEPAAKMYRSTLEWRRKLGPLMDGTYGGGETPQYNEVRSEGGRSEGGRREGRYRRDDDRILNSILSTTVINLHSSLRLLLVTNPRVALGRLMHPNGFGLDLLLGMRMLTLCRGSGSGVDSPLPVPTMRPLPFGASVRRTLLASRTTI